ncbi:MAG: 6-bladed beta-propeller [bacterium]
MPQQSPNVRPFRTLPTLILGLSALILATGCTSEEVGGGEWRHEVTMEEGVRTVRTLEGSVWGTGARLREEASIGVLDGPEEQMLGSVASLWAHEGRIYVLDRQIPQLRVYDMEGTFLFDVGREGEGPGEYKRPTAVAVHPETGRIYLRDGNRGRINIYTPDGEPLDQWTIRGGVTTSRQMVMTADGDLWTPVWVSEGGGIESWRSGMTRFSSEGVTGDTLMAPEYDFEEWQIRGQSENSVAINSVPFAPQSHWTMSPTRAMIGGVSDDYRVEVRRQDGTMTVIAKEGDRVPVHPDEARWWEARTTASMRSMFEGWAWNGPEVPDTKPAFEQLTTDRTGRIWVWRPGPGRRLEGCDEDAETLADFRRAPCWEETSSLDVFEESGRHLGRVALPKGVQRYPQPYIEGDLFLASVEDASGLIRVVRYRLLRP